MAPMGLLVPPKDQDALREAVKQLVEDPELRRSYGAKGREIALQAFTLRRVAEETIALYQSLLEGDR